MGTTDPLSPEGEAEARPQDQEACSGADDAVSLPVPRCMVPAVEQRPHFRQRSASMDSKIAVKDIGLLMDELDHE